MPPPHQAVTRGGGGCPHGYRSRLVFPPPVLEGAGRSEGKRSSPAPEVAAGCGRPRLAPALSQTPRRVGTRREERLAVTVPQQPSRPAAGRGERGEPWLAGSAPAAAFARRLPP